MEDKKENNFLDGFEKIIIKNIPKGIRQILFAFSFCKLVLDLFDFLTLPDQFGLWWNPYDRSKVSAFDHNLVE